MTEKRKIPLTIGRRLGPSKKAPWREHLFLVIFESDTPAGKLFDLLLILVIGVSVSVVMLDSVSAIRMKYSGLLNGLEWFFTLLFTVEYIFRLLCVNRPFRYAVSFFGIIDLLSLLPTYIGIFFPEITYMMVIRVLRILRVFRILKLGAYLEEADILMKSLKASRKKIEVFLFAVLMLVIIFGSMMYLVEGEQNGFTSIPRSVYWAIVTLTTVGYGDIAPITGLGQTIASLIMICGYGIIAVPTGIVTVELAKSRGAHKHNIPCAQCKARMHDDDALYCKYCGSQLPSQG